MRLGLLCGRSPHAMHVANTLCARLDVRRVVVETGHDWSWRTVRRALRPAQLRTRVYRAARPWLFPARESGAAHFFPGRRPAFDRQDLLARVAHVNLPAVAALLERERVEAIAVFGVSRIRAELLALTPGRLVNLHGGMSPWYRGADSGFWALLRGEAHRVGATVHRIDAAIDRGELLARCRPEINGIGCERMLFWRTMRLAARVFAETFERLARGEALGVAQPEAGRLYQARERRLRDDLALRRRLRDGRCADIRLPEQVEWFHRSTALAAIPAAARAGDSARSGGVQPRESQAAPRAPVATAS